jgi:hypothetical protein
MSKMKLVVGISILVMPVHACSSAEDDPEPSGRAEAMDATAGPLGAMAADAALPADAARVVGLDLSGSWTSGDYSCTGGTQPVETISIQHDDAGLVGTKTLGDPCVPTGSVSFRGKLPGPTALGAITLPASFPVTVTTGTPSAPASSTAATTLRIISANELQIKFPVESLRLTRVAP